MSLQKIDSIFARVEPPGMAALTATEKTDFLL